MKPVSEFKGYSAFMDDSDETVSFVSGSLSGAFGFDSAQDEFRRVGTEADAQKKSELQSLLLMASLMLGAREAVSGA